MSVCDVCCTLLKHKSFPLVLVTSQYFWDILYVYGTKRAAIKLHDNLLYNILRQPMLFFDSTPVGRLLSRFSSDINIVDARLPYFLKIIAPYTFRVRGFIVSMLLSLTQ